MNDLFFARSQMAMSPGFHIVFAALGIGMLEMMCVAEGLHLRTGRAVYLDLCRRWARGTAILFAVGAVSGTVLSFELELLWPGFMKEAGAIIGMPFSLEGFAFFSEAIFLGVTLHNSAAPEATLRLLTFALSAGAVLLLPALIFLFHLSNQPDTGRDAQP